MELGGSWFEASLRKVLKTLAQKTSQVWWCITVIPAMQEVKIEWCARPTPGKNETPSEK
jgi:hypothetical protein